MALAPSTDGRRREGRPRRCEGIIAHDERGRQKLLGSRAPKEAKSTRRSRRLGRRLHWEQRTGERTSEAVGRGPRRRLLSALLEWLALREEARAHPGAEPEGPRRDHRAPTPGGHPASGPLRRPPGHRPSRAGLSSPRSVSRRPSPGCTGCPRCGSRPGRSSPRPLPSCPRPWSGVGEGMDKSLAASLKIPLDRPSVFQTVGSSGGESRRPRGRRRRAGGRGAEGGPMIERMRELRRRRKRMEKARKARRKAAMAAAAKKPAKK